MITLLTDFGDRDVYVGVMKGVILAIAPTVQLVDLSHRIAPQGLWAAQFLWGCAYPYFAPDTIHLAVVDPGVGTGRRAIALQTAHGTFVAPDNGLLTPIVQREEVIGAIALDRPRYWRTPHPSTTFHGRDIFAPVAAYLAQGIPLAQLGSWVAPSDLVQLPLASPVLDRDRVLGQIQYIDHFGNCVSNIPATMLPHAGWSVGLPDGQMLPACRTYDERERGELVALVGSHGYVEIAQNHGSAQTRLNWDCGTAVWVAIAPTESDGGEN